MRIGILTLDLRQNYGGVLQAYALQTVLRRMGHQTVVLARRRGVDHSIFSLITRIISFMLCIFRVYVLKSSQWRIMNPFKSNYFPKKELDSFVEPPLRRFIETEISRTSFLYSSKSLLAEVNKRKLNVIVVGSDQVWREEYSPCITDYFLRFLPKESPLLRVAYAASFGQEKLDMTSESLLLCQAAIHRFDAISVRESSGVQILKNHFHIPADVVLDPTLLLASDDYERLIEKDHFASVDVGIVSYLLDRSEDKQCIVNHVRKRFPKSANYTQMEMFVNYGQGSQAVVPTMGHWLGALKNADFIVTDSFHGCVFSILFKKPFVAIANVDRGIDRFQTLFDSLGIEHRIVFNSSDYLKRMEELHASIDYDSIYERLRFMRKKSLLFLEDALNGTNKKSN